MFSFMDCSSLVFPVNDDCGTITIAFHQTASELSKCSVNVISYKSGFFLDH
jgi:hypothetical protein